MHGSPVKGTACEAHPGKFRTTSSDSLEPRRFAKNRYSGLNWNQFELATWRLHILDQKWAWCSKYAARAA